MERDYEVYMTEEFSIFYTSKIKITYLAERSRPTLRWPSKWRSNFRSHVEGLLVAEGKISQGGLINWFVSRDKKGGLAVQIEAKDFSVQSRKSAKAIHKSLELFIKECGEHVDEDS